jgi:hypothetical protein
MNEREAKSLIRWHFEESWKDFYDRVPVQPDIVSLPIDILNDSRKHQKHRRKKLASFFEHAQKVGTETTHGQLAGSYPLTLQALPLTLSGTVGGNGRTEKSNPKTLVTFDVNKPAPKRQNLLTYFRKKHPSPDEIGQLVKPVPPYTFCSLIKESLWVPEQPVLQFVHAWPDPSKFDFVRFGLDYENRYAWDEEDRDPDRKLLSGRTKLYFECSQYIEEPLIVDIILIESLNRIRAHVRQYPHHRKYLTSHKIDMSCILLQRTDQIVGWKDERQLFPFPYKGGVITQRRVEDEDPDLDTEIEKVAGMQELFCPDASCRYYACALHGESLESLESTLD